MKSKWQNILFECGERAGMRIQPFFLPSSHLPSLPDGNGPHSLGAPTPLCPSHPLVERRESEFLVSLVRWASIQDSSEHLFLVDFITG